MQHLSRCTCMYVCIEVHVPIHLIESSFTCTCIMPLHFYTYKNVCSKI